MQAGVGGWSLKQPPKEVSLTTAGGWIQLDWTAWNYGDTGFWSFSILYSKVSKYHLKQRSRQRPINAQHHSRTVIMINARTC